MAINGDVIMTGEILDAINCVFDLRVPKFWTHDPSGAEYSWLSPSLTVWLKSLNDRHYQIWNWIQKERPQSFWLTGFFSPGGFLTSMKQEVTQQKKAQFNWSLDEVIYKSDVTKDAFTTEDGRCDGHNFPNVADGVLIHGLFLEGAGWAHKEQRLDDAAPRETFCAFPVMHVTAVSIAFPIDNKKDQNKPARDENLLREKSYYRCPLYRYPGRRMNYLIETFYLQADSNQPKGGSAEQSTMTPLIKWRLCGTALLCQKS